MGLCGVGSFLRGTEFELCGYTSVKIRMVLWCVGGRVYCLCMRRDGSL